MKLPQSFLLLLNIAAVLGLTGCCSAPKTNGVATELFNGRDLQGWRCYLADPAVSCSEVWFVQNGVISCQGEPLGVLQTSDIFKNFRLVVEYRWAPGQKPGNNGILTRINGPGRPLPRCAEVQLQQGNAGDVLGLQGMSLTAEQARFFAVNGHEIAGDIAGVKKLLNAEKPPGEWNHVELLALDGSYRVWINGQLVNEVSGVEILAGPIGLQSEGGEIQFRRVTLTTLGG